MNEYERLRRVNESLTNDVNILTKRSNKQRDLIDFLLRKLKEFDKNAYDEIVHESLFRMINCRGLE